MPRYPTSPDMVKSLYGSTDLDYKVCDLLAGVTASNRQPLLDYLREHGPEKFVEKASFRTEEPLKGYRQWVLDALVERFQKNSEKCRDII